MSLLTWICTPDQVLHGTVIRNGKVYNMCLRTFFLRPPTIKEIYGPRNTKSGATRAPSMDDYDLPYGMFSFLPLRKSNCTFVRFCTFSSWVHYNACLALDHFWLLTLSPYLAQLLPLPLTCSLATGCHSSPVIRVLLLRSGNPSALNLVLTLMNRHCTDMRYTQ